MYIEEIHIISFKGFNDFKLTCSPFTTLVGLNSSGKTSILQAIQLVCDIVVHTFGGYSNTDIARPDFSSPQWQSNPIYGINRLTFGDPDALWLNKKTSIPCKISLKLSGGADVQLEIPGRNQYRLDILLNGISIKSAVQQPEHQQIIENLFALRPTYVPPVAGLSPMENLLNHPQLKEKLDKGLISECWRSNLFWLCNDGNRENFDAVIKIVQRYLPDAVVRLPQLTHSSPPQVVINFEEGDITFDISASGGGLRTLLSIAVVLFFSKAKCLLFDEPDAHLHGTLQRKVAQMLMDHAIENNIQVFVTSHAPDFIAEVPIEHLTWIDRRKNEGLVCDKVGQFLADLGTITKADAIRTHGIDKIFFVEGSLDRSVIAQLMQCFCAGKPERINPFEDSTTIIAELPNGKGDKEHLAAFQTLLHETLKMDVKIACIVDNDYDFLREAESSTLSSPLFLTLKQKEIENYLLDVNVISNALKLLAEDRKEHSGTTIDYPSPEIIQAELSRILNLPEIYGTVKYQVLPKYRESLDRSLSLPTKELKGDEWFTEKWGDEGWRIRNCPGKKVLAQLKTWCQRNYSLTLTPRRLTIALQQCPDDICEIMERLQKFFYG